MPLLQTIQCVIALWLGKALLWGLPVFRLGQGTTVPGRVSRLIAPGFLKWLGETAPQHTVIITGTNGKTTTTGILVSILDQSGWHVVSNPLGANMLNGITTGLIRSAPLFGKLTHASKQTAWVLEVDEANVRLLANEIPIRYVVVTNLFRDQLDRFGELDTTAAWIREGLVQCRLSEGHLFLNGGDGHVAKLSSVTTPENTTLYSVQPTKQSTTFPPLLSMIPCRFESASAQEVSILEDETVNQSFILDNFDGVSYHGHWVDSGEALNVPLPGEFNVWNAVAAASVARELGSSTQQIQQGLTSYQGVFGRADTRKLRVPGGEVQQAAVFLIKNPMGTQEVLKGVVTSQPAVVFLALNDNDADGRDVSWIWDAPFEWLTTLPDSTTFVCSGHRAEDMALRLHTIGLKHLLVECDLSAATRLALETNQETGKPLVMLPTYTALLALDQQVLPHFTP